MLPTTFWNYFRRDDTSVGRVLLQIIDQCLLLARKGGYRGLRAHIKRQLRSQAVNLNDYDLWVRTHPSGTAGDEAMTLKLKNMAQKPLFSVIIPASGKEETSLGRSVRSIRNQHYPFWELLIAFENTTAPKETDLLTEESATDRRIKITHHTGAVGLSDRLNGVLYSASGGFFCVVESGDEISADALFKLALSINAHSDADMLYTDEDTIDDRRKRSHPFFKPDWSPEYLESVCYTGSLSCYRAELSRAIGGFRQGFEGAEHYDFVLRFAEKARSVIHLPEVLYHKGRLPDGAQTSSAEASGQTGSSIKPLKARLERLDAAGRVSESLPGCFDTRRRIVGSPLVSIIIPSAGHTSRVRGTDTDLLAHCVRSITTTSTYPNYEIIIVDNDDLKESTIESISHAKCQFFHFLEKVVNVAKKMNLGALHACGDHLLFLNDDTEVISHDWIEAMLQFSQQSDVGAVGAKLYYENGTIQHVGATLNDDGLPDHFCRGSSGSSPGYYFSSVAARTCLAVTGACLMTRKKVFESLGGFNEALAISYNDIDYCLKVHDKGYRTVFTPHAELFHYETTTRVRIVDFSESDLFLRRWHAKVPLDPYYSIHLDTYPPNFRIRRFSNPPRHNPRT
jgi:O-antigen biosynthesis protein